MELQPSVRTPEIPPEIWMHVAQFIPHSDLCPMFTINRVFFQLSMDARYCELYFGADSNLEELWRVQRARDPSISHRVRHLYIGLEYGDEFNHQFDEEGNLNPGWTSTSLFEWIEIMTETATCLTNVTEFSVKWTEFPSEKHILPLLTTAGNSFGSRLRKLSFRGSLDYLSTLISTVDGLAPLRELTIAVNRVVGKTDEVLATTLAPFVNKFAPTLHSLSYSSINSDTSPFFHHLKKIPNLERLRICVKCSWKGHIEPFEATRFLRNHTATLRHLDWEWRSRRSPDHYLVDLLSGKDLEEAFSNLCTWRIGIPGSLQGFSMVVQRIRCSAQSLTALELFGHDMTHEVVDAMISIFTPDSARKLEELSFRVKFLSPELILLLAQKLPHLKKLTIHAIRLGGHRAAGTNLEIINANDGDTERENRLNAEILTDMMRTYDFTGWALNDINIWLMQRDGNLNKKLRRLLAECVPSLQTICGKDKEFHALVPDDDRL